MKPYFFGSSERQLFGVFHEAKGAVTRDAGVLLCAPIGQEYMRAHWAFRQLTSLLAKAGYPVLRFDYFGCGDSSGLGEDATLSDWRENVRLAAQELKEVSGVQKVILIGLRFGSVLAVNYGLLADHVEQIILWDPVVHGKTYLDGLRQLDATKFIRSRYSRQADAGEIMGFPFPPAMVQEIEAIDLPRDIEALQAKKTSRRVFIVASIDNPEYRRLADHLSSQGIFSGLSYVPDAGEWDVYVAREQALLASSIAHKIVKYLGGS